MKNKSVIITLIIIISIIIVLLVMFLIMALKGRVSLKIGFDNSISNSSNIIFEEQFETKDIKKIDINQDAGNIIFKQSTDGFIKVTIYGENKDEVKVNLKNSELEIDYTHKNNVEIFNFIDKKSEIIIYVPSDFSEEINIGNNYGNIEIIDLENITVNINSDSGDIQLGKVKNANIKNNYGNIDVKEILNKCDIEADCGNIKIDKVKIQENSLIKANLGNITINNTNDIYIDAEVDLGTLNINKNNRASEITLKIHNDCGNIEINNSEEM